MSPSDTTGYQYIPSDQNEQEQFMYGNDKREATVVKFMKLVKVGHTSTRTILYFVQFIL